MSPVGWIPEKTVCLVTVTPEETPGPLGLRRDALLARWPVQFADHHHRVFVVAMME
jgi:hypothetical protein